MNKPALQTRLTATAAATLLASLALVGCNRPADTVRTETTTSPSAVVVDRSDANRTPTSPAVKADVDAAKRSADAAVANAADAARSTGEVAGAKVSDAVITTSVNAELVKDKALSAMRIDVDTSGGRVALKGTAPNEAARERATLLASSVKGVVSVDNQLKIDQKM
jgi:hypothetical protein